MYRVRAATGLHARLREPEVLDLPLGDELLHGSRDVLDRHVRVDAMLVEQVDGLDAQPLQRAVGRPADRLGPAVEATSLVPVLVEAESELRGDGDLPVEWRERLADELFIRKR